MTGAGGLTHPPGTWGNERRPNGTVVLMLDSPLKTTTAADVVEVELFSPGVDDDGTADIAACATRLALGAWWPTLEKAGLAVHLAYGIATDGPWERRSRAAAGYYERLSKLESQAREAKLGIWGK